MVASTDEIGARMVAKIEAASEKQRVVWEKQVRDARRAVLRGLIRRRQFRVLIAWLLLPNDWYAVDLGSRLRKPLPAYNDESGQRYWRDAWLAKHAAQDMLKDVPRAAGV